MPCGGLLVTKRILRHLPSTVKHLSLCLFLRRERGHPPRRGPDPPIIGTARAECRPSRLRGRRDGAIIQLSCPSIIHLTKDHTSNCWPLEKHHYAEDFALSASFKTDCPPLWSGLLSPSTHADALRENRGLCLNCDEDNRSFKHRRHPFINTSGCLNPELGQLGDDDIYQRWQARMVCYRRDGKSSRPNNHKKNRRHHSGQSRGHHQDQGQVHCHNDNTYTSDHHGGIPPSPASSAPAPAPRMRFGAAHNPGGITHARQPGTFLTGNRQLDDGTAPSTTLSGAPVLASEDARVPVAVLSNSAAQIASVKSLRAPTPSADDSQGVVPRRELALRAWFPPAR